MVRFIRVAILMICVFAAKEAFAAGGNWYVLKGATGSNSGTSWTNAWNEMNQINFSTVACGDTIWLGGGNYTTSFRVNKTCTAAAVLTINRVLASDSVPSTAPGWNPSFDSKVTISNGSIAMSGAYWTVDGRV